MDHKSAVLGGLNEIKREHRPPVHLWHPPFCGDIDMRIASDGTWYYMGTPINRKPMVRLFASILRRDPERFVLVTPVEMVGIQVDDAPFLAGTMKIEGEGEAQKLTLTTTVEDEVLISADHPLQFEIEPVHGGLKPYCVVRDGLRARLTRSLASELVNLGKIQVVDGARMFGVWSEGQFFAMMTADEMGQDS